MACWTPSGILPSCSLICCPLSGGRKTHNNSIFLRANSTLSNRRLCTVDPQIWHDTLCADQVSVHSFLLHKFLGPRGPLVLPLVNQSAMKIWITYTQAHMPHESSGDSSNQPNGPRGFPLHPLDPLGPPAPPHQPPQTPKRVSWPH